MELNDVLIKRRSYRSFLDKKVEKEKEEEILKAAMLSPVAMGQYDNVKLVVYKNESAKKLQDELIKETGRDNTYGAPLLILIYHKLDNIELKNLDSGAIIENMLLKIAELDLGAVFIYSIKPTVNKTTSLNKYAKIGEYSLTSMVSVGYIKEAKTRDIEHKIEVIYK